MKTTVKKTPCKPKVSQLMFSELVPELSWAYQEAIVTCKRSSAVLGSAYIYSIKADNRAVNIVYTLQAGHPPQQESKFGIFWLFQAF